MRTTEYLRLSVILTAAGVMFSGYLSAVRATIGVCAFGESCPFFLGHPACYTGFALFLTLFAISTAGLLAKSDLARPVLANVAVSAVGVAFAGAMVGLELAAVRTHYNLGLSTCAYGLVFFVAALLTSLAAWLRRNQGSERLT
jgi:NADH:ubiquinone oxidoreductase subunit 6 (subunit J)